MLDPLVLLVCCWNQKHIVKYYFILWGILDTSFLILDSGLARAANSMERRTQRHVICSRTSVSASEQTGKPLQKLYPMPARSEGQHCSMLFSIALPRTCIE